MESHFEKAQDCNECHRRNCVAAQLFQARSGARNFGDAIAGATTRKFAHTKFS
jgi:hypothetical protein